ncbi:protein-tyrosine phosphatase-like protein [Amylostereum chailletii]|nr:protein-tyrosine phosphatase-like protein [Amylostereum chailletii]
MTSEFSELDPLDPDYVARALSSPPFVSILGVSNARDIGLLPIATNELKVTRPHFMYRSAEISAITVEGRKQLLDLGVTTVYDLRSDAEMVKYDTPPPDIPGIQVLHTPVFKNQDYSPETMLQRFQLYASGKTESFMKLYSEILDAGGSAYGTILRHVRDKPDEGFLFHCTAGKDRTGVIAAILLLLSGVDHEHIATDYALTRVGREPLRHTILKRIEDVGAFQSMPEAALNLLSSRHEVMIAFLKVVEERYGGAENYAKQFCDLTDGDLTTIRDHLVVFKP